MLSASSHHSYNNDGDDSGRGVYQYLRDHNHTRILCIIQKSPIIITTMSQQHSYLPGVTQVITGVGKSSSQTINARKSICSSNLDCIPVLKLHGVVLYPGFSLPLRLHDPSWISYLNEKVDVVRHVRSSDMNVIVGILTAQPEGSRGANNSSGKKDIGRIGTVAVIESTNIFDEGTVTESRSLSQTSNSEIILTVLGISRFRIISFAVNCPSQITDLQMYRLELLQGDVDPPNPPFCASMFGKFQENTRGTIRGGAYNDCTYFLDSVSPIPRHCWKHVWPHHLVEKIRKIILDGGSMLEWDGLRNASSFPGLKTDSGHFSFWLATHMPLSLGGKIAMLEMECVTERLRYILAFIQLKSDRVICCRSCGNKLASIADLFTLVGITEGTSGAYGK